MKKLLAILSVILFSSVIAFAIPTEGDDGNIRIIDTKKKPNKYHYTIVKEESTGCTVMIVEDSWNGVISQSTLKCD